MLRTIAVVSLRCAILVSITKIRLISHIVVVRVVQIIMGSLVFATHFVLETLNLILQVLLRLRIESADSNTSKSSGLQSCIQLVLCSFHHLRVFLQIFHNARVRIVASLSTGEASHFWMSYHRWILSYDFFIRHFFFLTIRRFMSFLATIMTNNRLLHPHLIKTKRLGSLLQFSFSSTIIPIVIFRKISQYSQLHFTGI